VVISSSSLFLWCLDFSSGRKQLLVTLLRLEFVVLVLYLSAYFYLCGFNYSLFFVVVYFFIFSVCEGSLGLSVLVSMIRSHGNDYFRSYRVFQR
jgi:NADH-ubiquinone oxidoreductase chain 4L